MTKKLVSEGRRQEEAALNAAELYDLRISSFQDDISLIVRTAIAAGPSVLELACGTGRVLRHLCTAGLDAWGIDKWEEALSIARLHCPGARVTNADIRDFNLHRSFNSVMLGFNALELLLTKHDVASMLGCVRDHLAPGGVFFVHTTPLDISTFTPSTGPKKLRSLSDGHSLFDVEFVATRNLRTRVSEVTFRYYATDPLHRLVVLDTYRVRPRTADEVIMALEAAGFSVAQTYGDFDLSPFDEESSPSLIAIAKIA